MSDDQQLPAAFQGVPDEVKQTILGKTGEQALTDDDASKHLDGWDAQTSANADSADTVEVPEITGGGES